jgi:REP element-mobilizing transposase RayT
MPALPRRRRIRLGGEQYAEAGRICSVTIAVQDRVPVFANHGVASAAVEILHTRAEVEGVPVYAYCVMPDHVHLLIEPSATCDIVTFVARFKNLAQRAAWRLGVRGTFWQASFWDHFLRREEQVEVVARYILDNPVRKGLVERWQDYPFSGSLVFELEEGAGGREPPPSAS